VACINSKAVVVIQIGMMVGKQLKDHLAKLRDMNAEFCSSVSEPVSSTDLMNAKQIGCISELIVKMARELEELSLSVRDLGDWAQGNKERDLVSEVI